MSRFLNIEQGTPEWHELRASQIGASEAAIILGESSWNTAYGLWMEKTGRKEGDTGGFLAQRGNEMEPVARSAYEIENGFINMNPICVKHPIYNQIGASLDGLSDDKSRILEIKYPGDKTFKEIKETNKAPRHYWIQIQHQLACTPEAKDAHFFAYRKEGSITITIERDEEFIEQMIPALLAFWELVKTDTPPPLSERDAKDVSGEQWDSLKAKLLDAKEKKDKKLFDELKFKAIEMAQHSKVRFSGLLISQGKKSITMRTT